MLWQLIHGNHPPIGVYGLKKCPKKIEEPEDSNRCGEESEIADKSAEEAMEKGKQAKVVIARADPCEIFRMSTCDYDLE